MKISGKTSSGVQEIKHERHNDATDEHGYRSKDPQKERKGEVKRSQTNRPKHASTVQVPGNII